MPVPPSPRSSQYAAPRRGQFLTATFTFDKVKKLAKDVKGEARRADPAIRDAHERLAKQLQMHIKDALNDAISAHNPMRNQRKGRNWRTDGRLQKAIESPLNRDVKLGGFSVGFLERTPAALYWRGLEQGTTVHIGQPIFAFRNARGGVVPATAERERHVDPEAIGIRGGKAAAERLRREAAEGLRRPVFITEIRRPIPAYGYQAEGARRFINEGLTGRAAFTDFYVEAFLDHGLDFFARWTHERRAMGRKPRVTDLSFQYPVQD